MRSTLDIGKSPTTITRLGTQFPEGLLGLPADRTLLSWTVTSPDAASLQSAYEIECSSDDGFVHLVAASGVVESSVSQEVPAPEDSPHSRQVRHFRVRIRDASGWSAWSPAATVERGLLSPADWLAVPVGIPSTVGGPAPLLRSDFVTAAAPVRARLYCSSLGLNDVSLNGEPATREVLNPGWTAYRDRVLVATHDVTALVVAGVNSIAATLADGWYRGRIGWEGIDSHYGSELALLAQLELEFADGTTQIFRTGPGWRGSFGAVRSAGIYDGCDQDATAEPRDWRLARFDDGTWQPVSTVETGLGRFEPRVTSGVRRIRDLPMTAVDDVFDAGQNIAGWVRLTVQGRPGDTVVVRHAEVLEPHGTLHTSALRSARATDTYVIDSDVAIELEPVFTFHGFRYATVETSARVLAVTAVAISSAVDQRSSFTTSLPALERLHANVQWSLLDNFVAIPSDCPQRDERLGWTGDAQAFAPTASTLFDTTSFWRSWLRDLELEQSSDGAVPAVVPNTLTDASVVGETGGVDVTGKAGWADAATMVPWAVYESTGATSVLERQLASMRRWVDYLDLHRAGAALLPTEFQFGDWLDPDAPGDAPWRAKVSADFVANSYFARSASILAASERLVGDPGRAERYAALAADVARATWDAWGHEAITSQTGCAIALEFSIAPEHERARVASALARDVREREGAIATGFLGTPLVLHALSRAGYLDEAYLMLLRVTAPSWLYQVASGATTVWERWDALLPDGSIHPGEMDGTQAMLSFNHYAYGSVIDWVYRNVAGIAPAAAGYAVIEFAPRPVDTIQSAAATIRTGFGEASIDWATEHDRMTIIIEIPFGATGLLSLPLTSRSTALCNGRAVTESLGHGRHEITITHPAIARSGR